MGSCGQSRDPSSGMRPLATGSKVEARRCGVSVLARSVIPPASPTLGRRYPLRTTSAEYSTFNSLGWLTRLLAAILDQTSSNQRRNNNAILVIEQAADIGHCKSMVDEQVANCNGSLSPGIEIHAIAGQVKLILADLKTISSFMALMHMMPLFAESKKPGGHRNVSVLDSPHFSELRARSFTTFFVSHYDFRVTTFGGSGWCGPEFHEKQQDKNGCDDVVTG